MGEGGWVKVRVGEDEGEDGWVKLRVRVKVRVGGCY
jgi:hypothetical protein